MVERKTSNWVAFAAGAVAMLALCMLLFAWHSRNDAARAARVATQAARLIPDIAPPRIPDAPRVPTPLPQPK